MREIGGYIEYEHYHGEMLHENSIKLNCGRNALLYLVLKRNISTIWMPKYMCDSCSRALQQSNVSICYYNISFDFKIVDFEINDNDWVYIVNYYGQYSDDYIKSLKKKYKNIILDCTQSYFYEPMDNIDTIYSCRKYFGVSDGAILISDCLDDAEIEIDESFRRMEFLLGRFERTASEFYSQYVKSNEYFYSQPIKRMSKLTENILRSIDYDFVKGRRESNFAFLHDRLNERNIMKLNMPEGPFMYPFYFENGCELREKLILNKIYIPVLWPNVVEDNVRDSVEFKLAKNTLMLPCDQRYDENDMKYIVDMVMEMTK